MKKMTLNLAAVLGMALLASQVLAGEQQTLKTQSDRENYVTGVSIVRSLKQQGGAVNLDLVIQGMKDELTGESLLVTEDELRKTQFALEDEPKPKQGCRTVEYPDHRETVCSKDAPEAAPSETGGPERAPVEEPASSALMVASLGASGGPALPAMLEQAPQEHTFIALLAAQEQARADGALNIELSELTRRHGEYWLRTLSRQ